MLFLSIEHQLSIYLLKKSWKNFLIVSLCRLRQTEMPENKDVFDKCVSEETVRTKSFIWIHGTWLPSLERKRKKGKLAKGKLII